MSSKETNQTSPVGNATNVVGTFFSATMLSILGFLIGIGILLFDFFQFNDSEKSFVSNPEFLVWLLSITAQTVFWAVATHYLLSALRDLKQHAKNHIPEIVIWAVLFAVLIYSSTYFAARCPEYNFRNHELKTRLLTYLGGVVAVIAGIGNVLVNIGLRNLLTNKLQQDNLENDVRLQENCIREYLNLRGSLLQFLSILGAMLGLVILAQGAKRGAITASGACGDVFTLKRVVVFGLYYTVILILVFLPTFFILVMARRKLQNAILPVPSPNSDKWDSWCKRRVKLDGVLAFTMTDSLRATIAILAPLIGSLIPLVVSLVQFLNRKP